MMKSFISLLLALMLAVPALPQAREDNPWKGKRVAYFGDSITDPRNTGSKKKYWNFLQEWLGITPYVYGISGRQWNDIPNQAQRLKKEHGNDFDAILIFMGTNDFNNAVPIGEWYNEQPKQVVAALHAPKATVTRMQRTPVYTDSTFRGRINIALSTLKKMWPDKQIVVLTPIHRALFDHGDTNIQPDETYQNARGIYFDKYVESVKEAGNIWAVPVIDLNAVSGLYPVFDEGAMYYHDAGNDRLHPNDAGHARIARTLIYQLGALPCVF